jgi:hypothetical protein
MLGMPSPPSNADLVTYYDLVNYDGQMFKYAASRQEGSAIIDTGAKCLPQSREEFSAAPAITAKPASYQQLAVLLPGFAEGGLQGGKNRL